jgi:RNA polymerase sigma factor (sigma-70 family)
MTRPAETIAQLVDMARDPALPLEQQHAAFARLVERSQHVVMAIALAALRSRSEAEDAAQDAFIVAWQRLRQLRDASAFAAWLRSIVVTQCRRRLRRRPGGSAQVELPVTVAADEGQAAYQSLVASAIAALPAGERHVTVLFYGLGYTLQEIGRLLHLQPGTVGKRLHSARLRIRRRLPPSVRGAFVRLAPSRTFVDKIRLGLFDEYVGEYRFERRPDLVVRIMREGDSLIGDGGGQRSTLASLSDESLVTRSYDGEGRFRRNRRGKVTHFVYYEFGRRLGIARKVRVPGGSASRDGRK